MTKVNRSLTTPVSSQGPYKRKGRLQDREVQKVESPNSGSSSSLFQRVGKAAGFLASTAAIKWVSMKAQQFSYFSKWNPSQYFPEAMKNFLDPENSIQVGLRRLVAGLVGASSGYANAVVETMILAPILEEVERMVLHYGIEKAEKMIAKRFFGVDDFEKSKVGKVLKVALSSMISGFEHYNPAVPKEIRFDARYLNDRARKAWIDDTFKGGQIANDSAILGIFISSIAFGLALELSGTVAVPIALHAMSNFVVNTYL